MVAVSADFTQLLAHLDRGLVEHADRDGLVGVRRATFMDRGGHAPGEACPSVSPVLDPMLTNPNWPYELED